MKKIFSRALATAVLLAPGLALAASNDVQLGVTNSTFSVNSATVTVAGTASTTIEQIEVGASTFTVTFAIGSHFSVSAPDISVSSMSVAQPVVTECASGVRTTTIDASAAGTATFSPSATACSTAAASSGGGGTISGLIGGGGGGGGSSAVPVLGTPVTTTLPATTATAPSTGAPAVTFMSDLTIGSENNEVTALQTFLINKGFLTMPAGVAMGYFGSLTQKALAAFQSANDISPAVGYFGPKTRTAVSAMGSTAVAAAIPAPTTPAVSGSFTRDLEVGVTGADVTQLQVFLNTHGFVVAESGPGSIGNETERFGALTRTALAKFQAENGITPSVGYFGPKTRAAVNAMMGN